MANRILVTGATGFLGAHVVHTLLDEGDEVRALVRAGKPRNHVRKIGVELVEGDLLDEESLERACCDVDGLVHCAALVGYWSRQNSIQRQVNVDAVTTLYRAAHRNGVQRIVHVSSVTAVGSNTTGEILDEETLWDPTASQVHYTLTKREGEERALAAAWGGLPIVVVNPSTIFGPRLDGRGPSALFRGLERGRLPWIPPGGISVTDVCDVATAIVSALRHGRPGERYLLAGHNLTWEQLYRAIADEIGGRVPQQKLTQRRLRLLAVATGFLDRLHLARPPRTPEVFRSYGMYSWFRSDKAVRELAYATRPLSRILRHATGRTREEPAQRPSIQAR